MNDPYINGEVAVNRLLKEYQEHGKLIVAVDFDGTINDFHNEGYEFPRVRDVLHRCKLHNFTIVVFTANKDHKAIYDRCDELDIEIDGININVLPQFDGAGKIYYNILLDDRAGLGEATYILERVLDKIEGLRL